jgi:DUF4097 and DUF4098 domain-containing protein YvlB
MAEHRFHTPEPVELEIKIPAGDIEVETVEGDESVVTVEGTEKLVEQTVVELVGNRLVVSLRGKSSFGISISIGEWSIGGSRLDVRVRVPHASTATLQTAAADMRLRGRFASLATKSASGDLTVDGDIERDAQVKTVSGDVRLPSIGGELSVQTVSGDVRATSVQNGVSTKSVSGDVRVESVHEGNVTAQSVSGDIEIGVAPGTNLDVDAGSVSGDLASEVPLGDDAEALGNGGRTLVVRGKTVSGDFRVFRAA